MHLREEYDIEIHGLAQAAAACRPELEHKAPRVLADRPGIHRFPHEACRTFNDWCCQERRATVRSPDHGALRLDRQHRRAGKASNFSAWTLREKLAEVRARNGDVYTFYGKLQALDRRVGVPFGWYFCMLHGNRVHAESGERVL